MVQGGSRFTRFVPALAALYLAAVFLVLLYPFHFSSPYATHDNSVAWPENAKGAQFGKTGLLVSAAPPVSLYRRLSPGGRLSIELWLSSASAHQTGPARIISYALNPWERNFTLGQQGDDLVIRLRTTATNADGIPSLHVANLFRPGKMQHIVVTHDLAGERVYVDGKLRAASATPRGDFSTWDPTHFLAFGNEVSGGRPWNGTIAYAAIYDRALPGPAVAARFKAGSRADGRVAAPGLLLAFDFAHGLQGSGSETKVPGMISDMPRMEKPAKVPTYSRLFFLYIDGKMIFAASSTWDLIRNVILFVPFGVFGLAFAERRTQSTAAAIAMTVAAAILVSATCEALQFFENERTSSILDLGTNAAGALVGALCYWCWRLLDGARRWTGKPVP
jgi:Concanavalin A-like lectin/glucanases superfamily/VanZ like family